MIVVGQKRVEGLRQLLLIGQIFGPRKKQLNIFEEERLKHYAINNARILKMHLHTRFKQMTV